MAAAERRFSGGSDDFESEKLDPRIQVNLFYSSRETFHIAVHNSI